MPSQYNSYDDANGYRRNGDRPPRIYVEDIPDDRISEIRRRELASFYGQPAQEQSLVRYQTYPQNRYRDEDDDYFAQRRMVRRDRFADDTDLPPTPDYRRTDPDYAQDDDRYYNSSRRSRRRDTPSYNDRDQSRDGGRRRRRNRARSERRDRDPEHDSETGQTVLYKGQLPLNKNKLGREDENGKLWYSAKDRSQANFFEKHFDSSYDGLFAAAAGAAIGAMGVRRMICVPGISEEENKAIAAKNKLKTLAGAVAGGMLFNAGENAFRVYTEEQSEYREHTMEGIECLAEGIDGLVPKAI